MSQSLQDLIAGTGELRSLPTTTRHLIGLLDDATIGVDKVLEVIDKDLSLTANLLKLCNSAYYGLRRQVGTPREALVMLGNRTVINLAFATSMGNIMRGPLGGYRLGRSELWNHALATALAASHLVSLLGDTASRERAFTGGLIHDIGKLLLNQPLKENLVQLPPDVDDAALLAAEAAILGFDHAQAGAALAEAWHFPPDLVQLIATCDLPWPADEAQADVGDHQREVVRAVAGANAVAGFCGLGGGARPATEAALLETMSRLGYGEGISQDLVARLPADLDAMLGVIGDSR